MFKVLNISSTEKKLNYISDIQRKCADELGRVCKCYSYTDIIKAKKGLFLSPILDIICIDIESDIYIKYVEYLRRMYKESYIFLIVDDKCSPLNYVRSSIRPAELVINPFNKLELYNKMKCILETCIEESDDKKEDYLIIQRKKDISKIPINDIFSIEASDKKILLKTVNEEVVFYDTIENLENVLERSFVRTHRSYLVNRSKISKILLSENLIKLRNNDNIPLSKNYKTVVKEIFLGSKKG